MFWLWEIPLAYALAIVLDMGPRGVFVAITIAYSTLAVRERVAIPEGEVEEEQGLGPGPRARGHAERRFLGPLAPGPWPVALPSGPVAL